MNRNNFRIAPSILSADFARWARRFGGRDRAGADLIHFRRDGQPLRAQPHGGPLVCEAIKPHSSVPIDVHLMVKPVDRIIPDFVKAGAASSASTRRRASTSTARSD
jgi:ribulose-phosphate 3-epimerase